jgi:hypothetical protein
MYKVAGVKSSTEAKALLRDLEDRCFGRLAEGRRGTIQFIFSAVNTQQ